MRSYRIQIDTDNSIDEVNSSKQKNKKLNSLSSILSSVPTKNTPFSEKSEESQHRERYFNLNQEDSLLEVVSSKQNQSHFLKYIEKPKQSYQSLERYEQNQQNISFQNFKAQTIQLPQFTKKYDEENSFSSKGSQRALNVGKYLNQDNKDVNRARAHIDQLIQSKKQLNQMLIFQDKQEELTRIIDKKLSVKGRLQRKQSNFSGQVNSEFVPSRRTHRLGHSQDVNPFSQLKSEEREFKQQPNLDSSIEIKLASINLPKLGQLQYFSPINNQLGQEKRVLSNPLSSRGHQTHQGNQYLSFQNQQISITGPNQIKSPQSFINGLEQVLNDNTLMKGFQDSKQGDNKEKVNTERIQIYQQDFEYKLSRMNKQLEKELSYLNKDVEEELRQQQLQKRRTIRMSQRQNSFRMQNVMSLYLQKRNSKRSLLDGGSSQRNLLQIKGPRKSNKNLADMLKQRQIREESDDSASIAEQSQMKQIQLGGQRQSEFKQKIQSRFHQKQQEYKQDQANQMETESDIIWSIDDDQRGLNDDQKKVLQQLEDLFLQFQLDDYQQFFRETGRSNFSQTRTGSPSNSPTSALNNQGNIVFNNTTYVDIMDNVVKVMKNDIIKKNDFYEMCKNYTSPGQADQNKDDPKLNYFLQCNTELVVALPALARIQNKSLVLSGYQLSKGICKAIKRSLMLFKNAISKIVLDNNGLQDDMSKQVFKGIQSQDDVKSLIISKNEIDKRTMPLLIQLLHRQFPKHLETLQIINCKIHASSSLQLLKALKEKTYLRKLSLVKVNFTEICIPHISDIISNIRSLTELDLSWNEFRPQNFKGILEAISKNRVLRNLNISWNNLLSESSNEQEIEFVVQSLGKFIKYNKNLLHFDLSYTRLNENALMKIGSFLCRAKTLISLHLSGNPGINSKVKEYLQTRIKCRDENQQTFNMISTHINSHLTYGSSSESIVDGIFLKQLNDKRKMNGLHKEIIDHFNADNKLIFCRTLGQKIDMPGSGQWKMLTEDFHSCWVCYQWIYTLVIWDRQIGYSDQTDLSIKNQHVVQEIIDKQISTSFQDQQKNSLNNPYITGTLNDWKPQKMIPLKQFCRSIDINYTEPFQNLKSMGIIREECKSELDLTRKEQDYLKKAIKKQEDSYGKNWIDYLKKYLKYKKFQILNQQFIDNYDPQDDLYVYACFAKPGKHIYYVKQSKDEKYNDEWFFHKHLVNLREEDIPIFIKGSKYKQVQRVFKKDSSVFRDWKEDTHQSLTQSFEDDIIYWKLNRFIKDETDRHKCEQLIRKNIQELKKIFTSECCKGSYPNIGWIDFSNFCERCKIFDKNVLLATIDRIFIATNVEVEKMQENPDKALCRFEFYEILVRIAQSKFKEPGICSTYHEALEKLLKENIFPNANPDPWQEFRENELWTLEVNDILDANLEGIKKVYSFYWEPRKKFMTQQDAQSLFMRDTSINFNEKDAIYCYGMSKMTVVQESESSWQYKQIKFVELLEMIGRAAHLKFKENQLESLPLCKKIEFVLDQLLKLVEIARKDVNIVQDEYSESDDEY